MASLYFGKFFTQRAIHNAGRTTHPDLWMEDIPRTLDAVGLRYERWKPSKESNVSNGEVFLDWIDEQLQSGHPVLVGSKIYPSEHAKWNTDHLMLVVGSEDSNFIINTNMKDRQISLPRTQLLTKQKGYSFVNRQGTFVGYAIEGFRK